MSHCFSCKDEIVLQKSEATGKWLRMNPNGTAHVCKTVDAKAKTISPLNVSSAHTQGKEMVSSEELRQKYGAPERGPPMEDRESRIIRMHNENLIRYDNQAKALEENTKAQVMVARAIQRFCDIYERRSTTE